MAALGFTRNCSEFVCMQILMVIPCSQLKVTSDDVAPEDWPVLWRK